MREDKIVDPLILQSCALHWYHLYLLYPKIDITYAMICKYLYWSGIRKSIRKEVNNCDTCQRTKLSNKKYCKLPAKVS